MISTWKCDDFSPAATNVLFVAARRNGLALRMLKRAYGAHQTAVGSRCIAFFLFWGGGYFWEECTKCYQTFVGCFGKLGWVVQASTKFQKIKWDSEVKQRCIILESVACPGANIEAKWEERECDLETCYWKPEAHSEEIWKKNEKSSVSSKLFVFSFLSNPIRSWHGFMIYELYWFIMYNDDLYMFYEDLWSFR